MANKTCKCGQRTANASGICDKCLSKVKLLNKIRSILGINVFERKKKKRKRLVESYLVKQPRGAHDQLCWYCDKACGGCSWSREFLPVNGWEAMPDKVYVRGEYYIDSYNIRACPEYKPLKMTREMLIELIEKETHKDGIVQ